ncbi:MAG: SdiA-regulated domain-containing protein [Desulfuromonadaceae bacterium]|nr:SdiA-regulated domain-containing protein [Desulfuromonadaceae bacterium]
MAKGSVRLATICPVPRRSAQRLLCLVLVVLGCQACFSSVARRAADDRPALGLSHYQLLAPPISLGENVRNASGITFHSPSGHLFLVLNQPERILELNPQGGVQRSIELSGFEDTEGIAWLRDDLFAVIEERRRRLVLFELTPQTRSVTYEDCCRYQVDGEEAGNRGLEGLSWDAAHRSFYLAKEKKPRCLYRIAMAAVGEPSLAVEIPWDVQRDSCGLDDLSDLYHSAATQSLLLLSDESRCVVEVDERGRELSRLWLERGEAGLEQDIPQPEGLTCDDSGRLYVCSEPNLLYVFGRKM